MRNERIIVPGISVIEHLAATAMDAADLGTASEISTTFSDDHRRRFDALLSDKTHARQTSLSWLREPPSRVGGRPTIATIRQTTHGLAKPDTASFELKRGPVHFSGTCPSPKHLRPSRHCAQMSGQVYANELQLQLRAAILIAVVIAALNIKLLSWTSLCSDG